MALSAENKKQLLAGLLLAVLAGVVYFQFFAGSEQTVSGSSAGPAAAPRSSPTPGQPVQRARDPRLVQVVTEPLPLALLALRGTTPEGGTGRNIFVYPTPTPTPTPTPPPPTPPPPPPPVTLSGINPSGVIARTGDFNLTLVGREIPPDAVAFINGRNYPTAVMNNTQVRVSVPAAAISAPGNLRVEVKSQSDPQLYSNPLNLNVAAPPTPPYTYVAYVVDPKGVQIAHLKSQADGQIISLRQGEAVNNWRMVSISPEKIEMLDTNYNIQHPINFTPEGSE